MHHRLKSILGLTAAIISISTASILIRFAQVSLSSLTIATSRLVLSSIILFPIFLWKYSFEVKKKLEPKMILLIFISGVFLAFHFASWITSLEMTRITSSVVLVTTTPIWVAILSKWFLGESVERNVWIGLCIAFAGIFLITARSSNNLPALQTNMINPDSSLGNKMVFTGNLLALTGAFCAAGYVITGKIARRHITTGSYVFLVYTVAGLMLFIISLILGQLMFRIELRDWTWLVLLALVPQVIGHSLINWALGVLPATYVSISLLGEPIGSSMLAYLFLGEIPALNEIIGAIIVLSGIVIASLPGKKNRSL